MRFSDLVSVHRRPDDALVAERNVVHTHSNTNAAVDDPTNSGFVSGIVDGKVGRRLRPSRRGFLRGVLATSSAATAASFANWFGPAREVAAQTGVVGTYPRRLLTYCPPYNSDDNCQPGCGSSPICTDCCSSDGYFRNDPANGYSLYAGGCGDGDIADGWLWRYKGVCGNCSTIEYRCSDGYVQTDTGPAPFICRVVTECVPLEEGQAPGEELPDAARPTNWRPAGSLEVAVDNGSSVTMTGWISDGSGLPASMRVRANQRIVHFGNAALPRGDIQQRVGGAGPNTGFSVSFPLEPGEYQLCVDALSGVLTSTVGCVNMNVGAGGSVRGPGEVGASSPAAPTATPEPSNQPEPTATVAPAPVATATPVPAATPVPPAATPVPAVTSASVTGLGLALPGRTAPSASPTLGGLQILRRSGSETGFASGWAGDLDTSTPAYIEVSVDGTPVAVVQTELPRPDVRAAIPDLGPNAGFAVTFALPPTAANVCVDAVGPDDGRRRLLGCRTIGADETALPAGPPGRPTASGGPSASIATVYGALDDITVEDSELVATGWAYDPSSEAAVVVALEVGGVRSEALADQTHPGVEKIYGVSASHGFTMRMPATPGQLPARLIARLADGGELILDERVVDVA